MHPSVIALFCIIFVVGIQGASRKTPTSLDKDAIELAQLAEKIWSLKPAILKRLKPLVYCQVMDQCCEEEDRSKAISFYDPSTGNFNSDTFENIMEQCMNTNTSNKEKPLCTALIQSIVSFWIAFRNPNVKIYMNIIEKHWRNLDKIEEWMSACNAEEGHAILCLSNTKLVKSCVGKMLQKIFEDDYKTYEKTVKDIKQVLTNANKELHIAFIMNTNKN